jgi:hypothetical protein
MGGQNSGRGGLPRATQQRIIRLIEAGKGNAEIAGELGVNQSTISHRRKKLKNKESAIVGRTSRNDVLDHAMAVAQCIEHLQYTCASARPLESWIEKIFREAERLRYCLNSLAVCLSNSSLRRRLAAVHADIVTHAGACAPSYVETIYFAGERLYVTINMLSRHGVLFSYKSRLHPSQIQQIKEPWPKLPVLKHMVYDRKHSGCLRSSNHLLDAIRCELSLCPVVNSDDSRLYLLKETIAARAARRVAAESQATSSRDEGKDEGAVGITESRLWLALKCAIDCVTVYDRIANAIRRWSRRIGAGPPLSNFESTLALEKQHSLRLDIEPMAQLSDAIQKSTAVGTVATLALCAEVIRYIEVGNHGNEVTCACWGRSFATFHEAAFEALLRAQNTLIGHTTEGKPHLSLQNSSPETIASICKLLPPINDGGRFEVELRRERRNAVVWLRGVTVQKPTATAAASEDAAHSDDFRSVRWYGKTYSFTAKQAPAVMLLWENWAKGTPDVGDETLLLAVDHDAPPAKLSYLFRRHPAWTTVIVAGGTKGTHRLAEPAKKF